MSLHIATLLVVGLATLPAFGASERLSMTCKNPRRDYSLVFDGRARTLMADGTQYNVLAVEEGPGRLVVVGTTVNDGPTFRAIFRPNRKIELYINSKLFQTDPCR